MKKSREAVTYADKTDYERWRFWEAALAPVLVALETWNCAQPKDGETCEAALVAAMRETIASVKPAMPRSRRRS